MDKKKQTIRGKRTDNKWRTKKYTEEETKTSGRSKINDPDWYVSEGQLAKDVGSLSFNNALGAKYVLSPDSPGTTFSGTDYALSSSIPGIMSIYTGPAVNPANGPYSALNLATKDLYKRVRRMNSGSSNYDAPDLMLYVLAMDSIYSAIFYCQRILGCANVYSQVNRFVGDAYIAAQGVEPSLVRTNLAQYRARLNMLITKVSAFATPRDINLFKRHAWMYQGIYLDESVKKAQAYMYVPAYIFRYVEDSGGPGYLKPEWLAANYAATSTSPLSIYPRTGVGTTTAFLTVDQLFYKIESCLQALIESQDINIMSGDILKAYGDEGIWKMSLVDENYATIPVYSDEVLDQIHNTTFVGSQPITSIDPSEKPVYGDASLQVFQFVSSSGNYLMYAPKFANAEHLSYEHVLDMCDDNPTPERVIVATRNMVHTISAPVTAEGISNTFHSTVLTCGSDMALCGVMGYISNNGVMFESFATNSRNSFDNVKYSRFHKAPIMYRTLNTGNLNSVTGEIGNFTTVSSADLMKLHETALLSLMGVKN